MIKIHIDFIDGTEVSYIEGLELLDKDPNCNFTTSVLTFFSNSWDNNVIVIDKHGRSIDRNELMSNEGHSYTNKKMRKDHNIYKMLVANAFTWKQPINKDLTLLQILKDVGIDTEKYYIYFLNYNTAIEVGLNTERGIWLLTIATNLENGKNYGYEDIIPYVEINKVKLVLETIKKIYV